MDKDVVKRQHLPTLLSMNAKQKAIKLFKKNQGLLRTTEAIRLGIHPRTIYQLRDEGLLEQLTNGIYRLVEVPDFRAFFSSILDIQSLKFFLFHYIFTHFNLARSVTSLCSNCPIN
jgi:Transcriptional regulator, AbiEi antitoxin